MRKKTLKEVFQCLIPFALLILIYGCASVSSIQTDSGVTPQKAPARIVPVKIIGEQELGSARLSQPQGITLDPAGNLYIVDSGNNRIVKCNQKGDFLKEAGGFGWDNGQFNLPSYATMDYGLSLYVTDTQNKRVQRLDNNLNFIQTIGLLIKDNPFAHNQLRGIALSRSRELYVADQENDCVWKLTNEFTSLEKLGGFEAGTGALIDPQGVAVDFKGNLYVADSGNDRIALFDALGNFTREFGRGIVTRPGGVEVGPNGVIYVANTYEDNLVVLDENGRLLFKFGETGSGEGEFSRPTDLKIYQGKTLYVVDSGNNRIQQLELVQ